MNYISIGVEKKEKALPKQKWNPIESGIKSRVNLIQGIYT